MQRPIRGLGEVARIYGHTRHPLCVPCSYAIGTERKPTAVGIVILPRAGHRPQDMRNLRVIMIGFPLTFLLTINSYRFYYLKRLWAFHYSYDYSRSWVHIMIHSCPKDNIKNKIHKQMTNSCLLMTKSPSRINIGHQSCTD